MVYFNFRALDFDFDVGKYRTIRIVGKRNLGILCKREIPNLGQHTFFNSWLLLQ